MVLLMKSGDVERRQMQGSRAGAAPQCGMVDATLDEEPTAAGHGRDGTARNAGHGRGNDHLY